MPQRRNRWNRTDIWSILVAGVLLVGGTCTAAEEVIVTGKDDRQIRGELIEQDEQQVVLDVAGIRTTLPRDEIYRIDPVPSAEQVYRQRRAELEDDDLIGRAALVQELIDMRAYDLARQELAALQRLRPDSAQLNRLERTIDARLRLEQTPPGERTAPDPDAAPSAASRTADGRLTQEQINRIRVYEIDLSEEPRVHVPRATLDKLFLRYIEDERIPRSQAAQANVRRARGHQQLALIFDLQARELYGEVEVAHDPPALRDFRSQIHRQYVLNYCATNQCHGGEDPPGGLALLNTHGNTDGTVYTNFYLLDQYRNEHGRMIDRATPARSLLLQHGLARDAAIHPHPDTPGWRPHFRNTEDARFQRYAQALRQLYQPAPDYGIDFPNPADAQRDAETGTKTDADVDAGSNAGADVDTDPDGTTDAPVNDQTDETPAEPAEADD
ncbi:MAG: hypothetical protein WD534_10440 [Phycisphaeraceae bacterium]